MRKVGDAASAVARRCLVVIGEGSVEGRKGFGGGRIGAGGMGEDAAPTSCVDGVAEKRSVESGGDVLPIGGNGGQGGWGEGGDGARVGEEDSATKVVGGV